MTRQISWSLAVTPGVVRNPTLRTGEFQSYLNWMGRYWDIAFPYQPNPSLARINLVIARVAVMESDIARRIIYMSNTHRFGSSYQQCRLLCHEFFHLAGGPSHLGQPHIMSTNGGTAGNFTMADCGYMRAYPWRSALRPWSEPNAMLNAFAPPKALFGVADESDELPDSHTCKCKQGLLCSIQRMFTKEPWV